jgi:hypothetical protein
MGNMASIPYTLRFTCLTYIIHIIKSLYMAPPRHKGHVSDVIRDTFHGQHG